MGNRANVVFTDGKHNSYSPMVYLHWNGGPESVYKFLAELDRLKVRADQDYEVARFIQVVGNFMGLEIGECLSLGVSNGPKTRKGIEKIADTHGDNGVYVVNRTVTPAVVERCNGSGEWLTGDQVIAEKTESEKKYDDLGSTLRTLADSVEAARKA